MTKGKIKTIKAIMGFIGAMFIIAGGVLADSNTSVPTLICLSVGIVLVLPTIITEIRSDFE